MPRDLYPKSSYPSGLKEDSFGYNLIWGRHVLSQLGSANEPQEGLLTG